MAVTEQKVRNLLDNPAATSVPSDTITANISRATNIVNRVKTSTATTVFVDDAITAVSVWLTYGSYMEGISIQMGAISNADQVKLEHLRRVAELFLNQVSATLVDLDPDESDAKPLGIHPGAFAQTNTEAFSQST